MQSTTSKIANRVNGSASTIASRMSNFSTFASTTSQPETFQAVSRIQTTAGARLISPGRSNNNAFDSRLLQTKISGGFQRRSLSSANAVAEDEPPRRRRTLETKDPIILVRTWSVVISFPIFFGASAKIGNCSNLVLLFSCYPLSTVSSIVHRDVMDWNLCEPMPFDMLKNRRNEQRNG